MPQLHPQCHFHVLKKRKKKKRPSKSERKRRKREREQRLLQSPMVPASSTLSSLVRETTPKLLSNRRSSHTTTANDISLNNTCENPSSKLDLDLQTLAETAQVHPPLPLIPPSPSLMGVLNISVQTTIDQKSIVNIPKKDSTQIPLSLKMECCLPWTQKLFVPDIQFVYPKTTKATSAEVSAKPYTLTLLRQEGEDIKHHSNSSSFEILNQTKNIQENVQQIYTTPTTIDESMDDIFNSKRKRKLGMEEEKKDCKSTTVLQTVVHLSSNSTITRNVETTPQKQDSSDIGFDSSDSDDSNDSSTVGEEYVSSSIVRVQSSKEIEKKIPPIRQQQQRQEDTIKRQKQSSLLSQQHDIQDDNLHNHSQHRPLSGRTLQDVVQDTIGRRPRSNSTDGVLNLPQCGLCDEIRVLQSHQWKNHEISSNLSTTTTTILKKVNVTTSISCCQLSHPRGLLNLGNTCFLNATLQCLAFLPTFCQCVISLPNTLSSSTSITHVHKNQLGGSKNGFISSGKKITISMQILLEKMHGISTPTTNLHGSTGTNNNNLVPLAPRALYSAIPSLSGSGRGYTFRPGRQEDAHEFLIHLLDTMHNGELQSAGINPKVSGWRDRLPVPRLDETTFIHRVFGGYLRSQVICTLCGYKSNTYDPFLDLALEVNKSSSLMSALSQFMKKETLDAANKWKCSGCNKHVCATKQLTVFRPPLSLVVQLKRFVYGGQSLVSPHKNGFYNKFSKNTATRSKVQKPIDFSTILELPLSDGRRCEYYLTGIIIHEGSSANSGHYTACIRKPSFDHNRDEWYHVDDASVSKISENSALQQKNAYVLFYTRKEVQLGLPRPPSRSFVNAEEAKKVLAARSKARADSFASQEEGKAVHGTDDQKLSKNIIGTKNEETPNRKISTESKIALRESNLTKTNYEMPEMPDKLMGETKPIMNLNIDSDHSLLSPSGALQTTHHITKAKSKSARKRKSIKVNRGIDSVEVFLREEKKANLWTFNADLGQNIAETSLLGNRNVATWDNEDNGDKDVAQNQDFIRASALNELSSQNKNRKRKMFLDTWDETLDKGKIKKVKNRIQNNLSNLIKKSSSQNPFHDLQQQNMNKKKGFFPKYNNKQR